MAIGGGAKNLFGAEVGWLGLGAEGAPPDGGTKSPIFGFSASGCFMLNPGMKLGVGVGFCWKTPLGAGTAGAAC